MKIREANDWARFEEMVSQLVQGLLTGVHGAKVTWDGLPVGGVAAESTFEMDWVVWLERTYDYNDVASPALLDFESTVRIIEDEPEYVAKKILSLSRLMRAPGGVVGAIRRLRANPNHQEFPLLRDEPVVYLLFVSNRSETLPDHGLLRSLLRGKKGAGGPLLWTDPTFDVAKGPTNAMGVSRGFTVTIPGGGQVFVGLVNRERLLEFTYLAVALNFAKRHDALNERFLHDLTDLAGRPILLETMPRKVDILHPATPAPIRVDGKLVTFTRFSIDPYKFLRLCTVLRLVSDYAYLQRLPDGPHLEEMARDVEAGGRFPTPVLCIPAEHNVVAYDQNLICHSGGAIVTPYAWHIIDGQHRAFSYYLVKPGTNVQPLDIDSYELASARDKAPIASALFLNVNFKAIQPPIDLALTHYAYMMQWPGGIWVPQKRGRMSRGDSKLYSSRILAARFLLELSAQDTVLHSFFKYRGAKEQGKTSIQSISTYLARDFELRDPADPGNPVAARMGTVKGASGRWTVPDPAPEAILPIWDDLVEAFDNYLSEVAVGSGLSVIDGGLRIQSLVRKNNNVFVGLWRAFYWFTFKKHAGGAKMPTIPGSLTSKVLPWLDSEDSAGHLAGPDNLYRSGAGPGKLSDELIRILGGP